MSWPSPIIFTSWGFRHAGDRWHTGQELADWCTATGFKTVAVQLGVDEHGHTITELADIEPLRAAGLHVVVWGVASATTVAAELFRLNAPTDDWMPQVENDPERDLVLDAAAGGLRPTAIVSTYGGASTTDDVSRLRGAGVRAVYVESYAEAGPNFANLDTMIWQGTMYGWPEEELFPCMGTYRGEMPDAYQHLELTADGYACYLAEPMNGDQWVAFGELANQSWPEPPPTPEEDDVDPVQDRQALDSHLTVSQAALSGYSGPKPKGRNTVIWRIAHESNDDTKWNKIRDDIVAKLDSVGVAAPD